MKNNFQAMVTGLGFAVPEKILTNAYFEKIYIAQLFDEKT